MNDNRTEEVLSLNQMCSRERPFLPEHRLMFAALKEAVDIFTGKIKARRSRWWTMRNWLFDPRDDYLFSCVSICEYLGISHDALVSKLRRHQRTEGIPNVKPSPGVYWNRKDKRWRAYGVTEAGEKKYLGGFKRYRVARETVRRFRSERGLSRAA